MWLVLLAAGACGQPVDLQQDLEVTDVTTGWFDEGIVDGKNKLVPTVSFRLHNTSDRSLGNLQVNAIFRRVGEEEEWSSAFAAAVAPEGIPPGQTSDAVVIRSGLGYTGEQPRVEMLQHSEFVDARVEIFVRHRSPQWIRLGEVLIDRQLLTPRDIASDLEAQDR